MLALIARKVKLVSIIDSELHTIGGFVSKIYTELSSFVNRSKTCVWFIQTLTHNKLSETCIVGNL